MTKLANSRDAATSTLRKLGVNNRDYDLFIAKTPDGKFAVDLALAKFHVAKMVEQTKVEVIKVPQIVVAKIKHMKNFDGIVIDHEPVSNRIAAMLVLDVAPKTKKVTASITAQVVRSETISQACRRMILAGSSNLEVWQYILPTFQCDDKKRGYAAWFRTELKNKGLLAK